MKRDQRYWLLVSLTFPFIVLAALFIPVVICNLLGLVKVQYEEILLESRKVFALMLMIESIVWASAGMLAIKDFIASRYRQRTS